MWRFLLIVLLFSFTGFFIIRTVRNQVRKDLAQIVPYPSVTVAPTQSVKEVSPNAVSQRSLFVPYWTLKDSDMESSEYSQYLYFGITPGKNGINRSEDGYKNMDKFLSSVPKNSKKQLVVRMIDSAITFPILKDKASQNALIIDSIEVAKDNGFKGIVLDLEISAVPFDSLIKQINEFTALYNKQAGKSGLEFTIMLYGDSFYRIRPFDVKTLSKNADQFMIMSYDFSKSRGNPGPNFPLKGKEVYGYDMTVMIEDFLRYLPPEKTIIVFGLFGYDWEVDDKGKAIGQGEPLTYSQIKGKFLGNCTLKDCDVKRKFDSGETEVRYTDEENKKHTVWFEDPESVKAKEKYLKGRGINNFSTWAHSYF